MHFDARDALAERRRLVIEEAEAGDADDHQLVAHRLGRRAAREHVLGGHEPLIVVPPEVHVERAIRLQRHGERADAELEALTAAIGEAKERRAARHASHFHRQRRHDHLADARNERHAAHHAFRIRADQAATAGGAIDLRAALQLAVEAPQRQLALVRQAHRCHLRRKRKASVAVLEPGDAQHHPFALNRLGERGIGAGRRAVGLDEQQIDADGSRLRGKDGR